MTLTELNVLRTRIEKKKENDALLSRLKAGAGLKSPTIDDMPRMPGVSDKVGALAIEIADLEAKNSYLNELADAAETEIRAFTETIEDDVTRLIFNLRFISCLSWGEVAKTVGGRNNEHTVKKTCYRYLHLDDEGWRTA